MGWCNAANETSWLENGPQQVVPRPAERREQMPNVFLLQTQILHQENEGFAQVDDK